MRGRQGYYPPLAGRGFSPVPGVDVTVLEDFEGADPLSNYGGDTGNYTVQSTTVLEGATTLEGQSDFQDIGHTSITTERGHEYRCYIQGDSADSGDPVFMTHIQDPTASAMRDNAYWMWMDPADDEVQFRRYSGGTATIGINFTPTGGVSRDTLYQFGIRTDTDRVMGVVYDANGNELGDTGWQSEGDADEHQGGAFGFYLDSATGYFDYVTERPL